MGDRVLPCLLSAGIKGMCHHARLMTPFKFHLFVYSCVKVYMCQGIKYTYRGQKTTFGSGLDQGTKLRTSGLQGKVSFSAVVSSRLSWDRFCHWTRSSPVWLRPVSPRHPPVSSFPAMEFQANTIFVFFPWCWDMNSDSHVFMAKSFPITPCPQPYNIILIFSFSL